MKIDRPARALDGGGAVIADLCAVGNDMASIMGGTYPSGGISLGPAMTFGYIAARHMAGENDTTRAVDARREDAGDAVDRAPSDHSVTMRGA